jgi:IS5 family transposase
MQYTCPINPTSLTKWRQRLGAERLEMMLTETIRIAQERNLLKENDVRNVVADTTVQEKNITFPTDSKLYHKMRDKLVRLAYQAGLPLRQSYRFVGKTALFMHSRYAHARQMKRARRSTRKLKTYLGRVIRDIERKLEQFVITPLEREKLAESLQLAKQLLAQTKYSKNKIYSIHAPEVECLAKGKAHKRYEFGCKASFVTTAKNNWIVAAEALHGNPYDGHTLASAIEQTEKLTGVAVAQVVCDLGYRGHNYAGQADVKIVRSGSKTSRRKLRKIFKRRSSIEPTIGHLKSDNRLDRNYLKGQLGDKLNVILAAAGYNFRKLLRGVFFALIQWFSPQSTAQIQPILSSP